MDRRTRIETLLIKNFSPNELLVYDFTHEHSGHHGQDGGLETHIRIKIRTEEFKELSLLESHRRINDCLKEEFHRGLHALEIHILK